MRCRAEKHCIQSAPYTTICFLALLSFSPHVSETRVKLFGLYGPVLLDMYISVSVCLSHDVQDAVLFF